MQLDYEHRAYLNKADTKTYKQHLQNHTVCCLVNCTLFDTTSFLIYDLFVLGLPRKTGDREWVMGSSSQQKKMECYNTKWQVWTPSVH